MKKHLLLSLFVYFAHMGVYAQVSLDYQKPSPEILELVDVPRAPVVLMDSHEQQMVLLHRNAFKTIEELSKKELRLGGLRIDPLRNIGSRITYYNGLSVQDLEQEGAVSKAVSGLPLQPQLSHFSWSPDQSKLAFAHTTAEGVELWVLDIAGACAKKLTEPQVNANMGDVFRWFADGEALLVKMLSPNRKPLIDSDRVVPRGPTVSVADGEAAQNRTYQDLLRNKNDEANFEQLAGSEVHKVSLDGTHEIWLGKAMYSDLQFSPDGEYVVVTAIEKPFSYLVPYTRFPFVSTVYTKEAERVKTVLRVPLIEDLPKGFMATREGRRHLRWRSDRPATLTFVEALDGGDPETDVEFRDELKQLNAPFDGEPVSLLKTRNRFSSVVWGSDHIAVAHDYWWTTRNTKSYLFNPADASRPPQIIFDRNEQDKYSDPGYFVTERNEFGRDVLSLKDHHLYLLGEGHSAEGQFPFLDEMDLVSGDTTRLYRSGYTNKLELLRRYDVESNRLLTRTESPVEYPNYFFRDLTHHQTRQITAFENPFRSLRDVHKEVISYKRADGLDLSGTLYLPLGYDRTKQEKAPMILWAYPREFKDKASAGQKTANSNKFTYPYYGSPLYWVTKGYVVLDRATFPIVGEGEAEPNDTFLEQLVANAKAAIDAVDERGYIDREKVAVGGHSYGAFMVANLLSHSDLFAAGIARSGAYNRTLTPFGFQSEERNFWEAPDVYTTMSPFMSADKMKKPLLLIHGEADNNAGTYPLQSTRYFNALKGLGATVRLVMLPWESHRYVAKESILHLLWEQEQWLDRYVK